MKKNNRKKWIAAATALAAVGVLVGTFAWFTSNDQTVNKFEGGVAGNDVEVVETFTPPTDWKPGQTVEKKVGVLNSGTYDSFTRVSLSGKLTKLKDPNGKLTTDVSVLNGKNADQVYLYTYSGSLNGFTEIPSTSLKYTTKDSNEVTTIKDGAPSFTVASGAYAGTYTLRVLVNADGQYTSYWNNPANNTKYYAKVGSYSKDGNTVILQTNPQFEYLDLTSDTPVTVDWLKTKPTVTVQDDGTATVTSNADENIQIHFVNLSKTPTTGKWFYNDADGYFYYVGKLAPQETTELLIDSVTLNQNADNSYTKVKYDLTINADGIQARKGAPSSDQWVNGTNDTLSTALEDLAN